MDYKLQIFEECPNCKAKRIRELPWWYPGALCWTCEDLITDAAGRPVTLHHEVPFFEAVVTFADGRQELLPLNEHRFRFRVAEVFIGGTPYIGRPGKFDSVWVQSVEALEFEEQAWKEFEEQNRHQEVQRDLSPARQFDLGAEHGFPSWLFSWATDYSAIEKILTMAGPLLEPDQQLFADPHESRRPNTRTIRETEDSENDPTLVKREIDATETVPASPNEEMLNPDTASVGSPFINKNGEIVGEIVEKKPAKDGNGNPVFIVVYKDRDGWLRKTVVKRGVDSDW